MKMINEKIATLKKSNCKIPNLISFKTDSPDSGHEEMSTESLALQYQKSNTSYWQNVMNGELISLSSPANFTPGAICQVVEDIAAVTGNPLASGFLDHFDEHDFFKGNEHIITPCPPQDASGNRLELKLTRTPKIAPPPEFRNSKSYRDSQCSFQSTESASSTTQLCLYGHPKVITFPPI